MTIETMKLALEALEKCMYPQLKQLNAITAIRTAIAEAEKQEPVAWMFTDVEGTEFFEEREDWEGKWTPLYTTPPAAQREPAPGYCKHCKQYTIEEPLPAAQRAWVGLTPTDMKELSAEWWEPNENEMALINWIEAKLKEKNT